MKRLLFELRCLLAESLLGWALRSTPKGSDEELAMCYAVAKYRDTLKEQARSSIE